MNLLVLSSRPPWPPTMADAMTVDRLVRFLAARGHTVDLACFVEDGGQEARLREGLGGVCRRIETVTLPRWRSYLGTALSLPSRRPMQCAYFASRAMHERVARLVADGGYDLVYTHLIRMAEYSRRLPLPKVVALVVSQALNLERLVAHASQPLRRAFYRIEAAKVRPYEVELCADYERVVVCGPADVAALERVAPVPNAIVRPHGQDVPPLDRVRGPREAGALVMSGVMSTYTNVDAACWFAGEVLPRVRRERPEARFWVVGRNPQRAVRELAGPHVVVTGEVPDVEEWLCRAQVGVAPVRIAAGMQNKLVQAMGCELPVVATSAANEGIQATPDEHLLVRDEPQELADAVVRLLGDETLRQRLGRAARAWVSAHWTWEAHFERFERELQEAAAAGRAGLAEASAAGR